MKKFIDIVNDEKADKETILSGFKQLDRLTKGFGKSDLVYIGARPGMGKTTFAVNLAENITMAGKKCAFFSLELSTEGVEKRFLRINSDMKIYIDDNPAPTVSEIKQKVKDLKDVDCAVIDYLGLIKHEIKEIDRTREVYDISKELKRMAKELDISVVCITQLQRYEGKPKLSDLRECAFIEQDADAVLFLHRDDFTLKNINNINPHITELIIAKNNYGDTGIIKLKYDSQTHRFTETDV